MNKTHEPSAEVAVVLGRIPQLSVAEIEATLKRCGCSIDQLTVTSGVALVKASPDPDETWFLHLGGSVKFGRVITQVAPDVEPIVEAIQHRWKQRDWVGLSRAGNLGISLRTIAGALKAAGVTRRYVLPQQDGLLSGAQSKQFRPKRDLELLFLADAKTVRVIEVTATQDIDDFTQRDRMMPAVDARRGMLPTKLARAMVNIGLGPVPSVQSPVLLDPFCGTGRVLMEGCLLGTQVLGADIDPRAVAATIRNLTWTAQQYQLKQQPWAALVVTADIVKLAGLHQPGSVDVIVTEPDLGPPQQRPLTKQEASTVFDRLEPTYLALLEAGRTLLTSAGGMVVALPSVGGRSLLNRIIDRLPDFGYHLLDSIPVARPDQFISREIVILRKT